LYSVTRRQGSRSHKPVRGRVSAHIALAYPTFSRTTPPVALALHRRGRDGRGGLYRQHLNGWILMDLKVREFQARRVGRPGSALI
jgi:hypothetical protein